MKKKLLVFLFPLLAPFAQANTQTTINGIWYNIFDTTAEVTYKTPSDIHYYGEVIIPESITYEGVTRTVTSIGDWAFYYCKDLTSLTIPKSITSIGNGAFCMCDHNQFSLHISDMAAWCNIQFNGYDSNPLYFAQHLYLNGTEVTDLVIPNGVTSINDNTFVGFINMTSVTIPNSVTSIGDEAFEGCSGLTSITIPNSVTSIGDEAFRYCSGLASITIPNNLTSIGSYAFNNTVWYDNQPDGLVYLDKIAYIYKGVMPENTSIIIQEGTLGIAGAAFNGCNGLTSITIPNSMKTIGKEVFLNCKNLTTVTIPNSVTSIGDKVFFQCTSLTSVTIGDGVTSIGISAFYYCTALTSVTIGNSVTKIDYSAFKECSNLTSVHISDLAAWCNIQFNDSDSNPLYFAQHLYLNGTEVTDLVIPNDVISINKLAFYGCNGLTSVNIPNSVTFIGSSAFYGCTGLTSVNIGNSLTSIGSSAFYGCTGLTSVTIPNSVTSIDDKAFYGCTGLTSVTIGNSVTSIRYGAFYNCSGLTSVTVLKPTPPLNIGSVFSNYKATLYVPIGSKSAYENADYWKSFKEIVEIEDENHIIFADQNVKALCVANWDMDGNGMLSYEEAAAVTDLGDVFSEEADITSFNELQHFTGLTIIGDRAFMDCYYLANVTLPESITSIGTRAFYGCNELTSLTIPQGVNEIGTYAFRGCTGLTEVYCLAIDVPTTATNAFSKTTTSKATLHVVVSSYNAYKEADPWMNFKNMVGDIPIPCETPVINYMDKKIVFSCDTEGVTFKSSITSEDVADREVSEIDVCATINISVYAMKEGYNPSETVTATLCWVEVEPVDGVATGTVEITAVPVLVKSRGGVITVEGVGNNTSVSVYTTDGVLVGSATAVDHTATISTSLTPGTVAIVDLAKKAVKVVVR